MALEAQDKIRHDTTTARDGPKQPRVQASANSAVSRIQRHELDRLVEDCGGCRGEGEVEGERGKDDEEEKREEGSYNIQKKLARTACTAWGLDRACTYERT